MKRRCRRILWFTRSFLKSPGEPRGESRGDPGPGARAGEGGPCIAGTVWRLETARAVRELFWTALGAGPAERGQRTHSLRLAAGPLWEVPTRINGETEAWSWAPLCSLSLGEGPMGSSILILQPLSSANMSYDSAGCWANLAEKNEMQNSERDVLSIEGLPRGCPDSASSPTLPVFQVEKLRPGVSKELPGNHKLLLFC